MFQETFIGSIPNIQRLTRWHDQHIGTEHETDPDGEGFGAVTFWELTSSEARGLCEKAKELRLEEA